MKKTILSLTIILNLTLTIKLYSQEFDKIKNKIDVKKSVVKIYTVKTKPYNYNPWNMLSPVTVSGSGAIIEGNLILTNAHVVSDHTFIQVRLYGSAKKYRAQVLATSHEADLAILTLEDKSFFSGTIPLKLGPLPEIQEKVTVYGFPEGGDALSITEGVISRIEHNIYAHSSHNFLTIQIDAAINSGNSGGPVLVNNKIIGVAMQARVSSENIGYIIPVPIIRHFLEDLKDGQYHGFPEEGLYIQSLENEDLKSKYGLAKDETGVLVLAVLPGSPCEGIVKALDVVLSIDGHQLADDGTVEFRPNERTSGSYYVQLHQIGEQMRLKILRDKIKKNVLIKLSKNGDELQLIPKERYDRKPTYFIYGGLVFTILSKDYFKIWGKNWQTYAPADLQKMLYYGIKKNTDQEIVVLMKVMPHEINKGYHNISDYIITAVNGENINNIKDLIRLVEQNQNKEYIEFISSHKIKIVLNTQKVKDSQKEIFKIYNIPVDRSSNLLETE